LIIIQALNTTAEISYYIASTHQRQGYGSFLVQRTITEAKLIGYSNLVALLLASNKGSIKLLKQFEFAEWGRIPKAAKIDNKLIDHLYYGRSII